MFNKRTENLKGELPPKSDLTLVLKVIYNFVTTLRNKNDASWYHCYKESLRKEGESNKSDAVIIAIVASWISHEMHSLSYNVTHCRAAGRRGADATFRVTFDAEGFTNMPIISKRGLHECNKLCAEQLQFFSWITFTNCSFINCQFIINNTKKFCFNNHSKRQFK